MNQKQKQQQLEIYMVNMLIFYIYLLHLVGQNIKININRDYVDRGCRSLQVILLLLVLKLINPKSIYLLRGNHETVSVNSCYGFMKECQQLDTSQTQSLFNSFNILFQKFPIGCILNDTFFCIHGGLTPQLQYLTIDQLQLLDRKCEPLTFTPVSDLLWSDPVEGQKDQYIENYRGSGFMFNKEAVFNFLQKNNLKAVIRAHQVAVEGFQELLEGQVLLVWSAPNYGYKQINKASVLELIPKENQQQNNQSQVEDFYINQYNQTPLHYTTQDCCQQPQSYHMVWKIFEAGNWQDEEAKLQQISID